ncbi:MAG: 16S rRNA (cytosine(967)-C(5))-methyltransferase RsmB [Betaproteobacteria bacterium]
MTSASPHCAPLWQQLQAAADVLAAIGAGQSSAPALGAVAEPLRPAAQALAYHGLRQWGRAQALRSLLAPRPPPPAANALLCLALALIWREAQAPYEAFTLVDQAVEAAKRGPARAQASFINACLRRFLRERGALLQRSDADPVALWNHPRWWISRLQRDYPQTWQSILQANNEQAPMSLRVNLRKTSVEQYRCALAAVQKTAAPVGACGLVLEHACAVGALPGFDQGLVSVQDSAAQMAAPLLLQGLDLNAPLHVLDACAAPGAKTAHLLEMSAARVTALDLDPARCERIAQTLQRLGLAAQVLAADAARPDTWWPQQCQSEPFDAILLDAPCTASGIVRRHPDVRWLRRESDIAQLAATQARLLQALWPLLKPGGRLLYCTCSVFRAEGQGQVETFLGHHSDAVMRPSPGHLQPQNGPNAAAVPDNVQGDHDGFFYALLEKRTP